jgi:hypothetical protein
MGTVDRCQARDGEAVYRLGLAWRHHNAACVCAIIAKFFQRNKIAPEEKIYMILCLHRDMLNLV